MPTVPAPRRALACLLTIFTLVSVFALTLPGSVTATELSQTVLVNPNPVNNTPHVLNGRVLQFARIGTTIYVAGSFTQVQASGGGPVLNRTNVFAFDVNTGAISPTWTPNVNGEVNSLQVMPDGSGVFLGGAFRNVGGAASRGVAKVHPTTGARIASFSAPTNGNVAALALNGSRLFVGGKFSAIKGVSRSRLAAVNTATGAVDAGFNLPITDPYTSGTAVEVAKMDVTPSGDRMVIVGNFRTVGGQTRVQLAQIDLTANAVATWRTDDMDVGRCASVFYLYPRDVQYSPDGSYFAMVTTGAGYFPETLCDTTTRWETYESGPNRHPTWIDYSGGDTLYGVAITGAAIYVGGHQRWMNNAAVGDVAAEGAVAREGIAALDPVSGRPFSWNPGRARGVGVFDMLAVPQGLLVGSDTQRLGGETHRRVGMFPIAGGRVPVVGQAAALPGDLYTLGSGESLLRFDDFNGGPPDTTPATVNTPGTDWSTASGAFTLNGRLYAGFQNGNLVSWAFDGTSLTDQRNVLAQANYVLGPEWISFAPMTGMYWKDGRLYYTQQGDDRLFYRSFSADSGVIGSVEYVADPNGWSGVAGMTEAGNFVFFVTADGTLHRVADDARGVPFGPDTVIGGPGIDGRDYGNNGMFVIA